jgi:hypothetical protein
VRWKAAFAPRVLLPDDIVIIPAGECYAAQWFDRAWLAVRSLETLLTRGGLQKRLQTLFDYSQQKDPQIDVDEWLVTIENTENTLRGWASVWVYGSIVPELKTNFDRRPGKLILAVYMQPPPTTLCSQPPHVRIRVFERGGTQDCYVAVTSEVYSKHTENVTTKEEAKKMKPPAPEGAFNFGPSVFDKVTKDSSVMWLCTDPNKSWLARVCFVVVPFRCSEIGCGSYAYAG